MIFNNNNNSVLFKDMHLVSILYSGNTGYSYSSTVRVWGNFLRGVLVKRLTTWAGTTDLHCRQLLALRRLTADDICKYFSLGNVKFLPHFCTRQHIC